MVKNLAIAVFLALGAALHAQVSNPSIISVAVAPSGACVAGLPNQQVVSTGTQYSCQNVVAGVGTWGASSGNATQVNGASVPASQSCLGSNGSSQLIAGPACTWPFQPQFAYFGYTAHYHDTTWADSSGSGNTATMAGGANQPSVAFNANLGTFLYSGMIFNPKSADQWITIPNAATCGVKTVIALYTPTNFGADSNGSQVLLADNAFNGFMEINSQFGLWGPKTSNPNNPYLTPMLGNVAWGIDLVSAGLLPYGNPTIGQAGQAGGFTFACGGGVTYIGHTNSGISNSTGFSGAIHALVGFSQQLSVAQIKQAVLYAASLVSQNGGPSFTQSPLSLSVIYSGDSRMKNFGGGDLLTTSRPFYISNILPLARPFTNYGVNGITLATIVNTSQPVVLQQNTAPSQTLLMDAIINDIQQGICTPASACYTTIQNAATTFLVPSGAKGIYATPTPANFLTNAQEVIREGVNSTIIPAAIAGTFNWPTVDDIADDPIIATQFVPNNFITTIPATISITSCSFSAGTVTCTLGANVPNYQCFPNTLMTIAGSSNGLYNGLHTIATCSGSTVTYTSANTGVTGNGGTIVYNGNGNWTTDGTHENGPMNLELSTQEAFAIEAANGSANECTIINKQIPWQVPAAANSTTPALTQTVPLFQLFPNWQVCSLAIHVTSAYSGTTTMTMSVGDNAAGGTATTYLPATSIQATGTTVASVPTFQSASGQVYMTFTATGTNVSTANAGNVNVDIGVVVRP